MKESQPKQVVHLHGIGTLSALGLIFVTLKLTGVINWSWWWVTLPWWGAPALAIAFAVLVTGGLLTAGLTVGFLSWLRSKTRR